MDKADTSTYDKTYIKNETCLKPFQIQLYKLGTKLERRHK